jgi:hypothetical protein
MPHLISFFLRKQKQIQKLRKQIRNKILLEADIERVRYGHGRKVDDYRKQDSLNHAENSSNSSKLDKPTLSQFLGVMGSRDGLLRRFILIRLYIDFARLIMQNTHKTEISI